MEFLKDLGFLEFCFFFLRINNLYIVFFQCLLSIDCFVLIEFRILAFSPMYGHMWNENGENCMSLFVLFIFTFLR